MLMMMKIIIMIENDDNWGPVAVHVMIIFMILEGSDDNYIDLAKLSLVAIL